MAPLTRWDAHEYTAAAGTRIHAALLGPVDAPTVVCVHGLGVLYRYFLPLAPAPRRPGGRAGFARFWTHPRPVADTRRAGPVAGARRLLRGTGRGGAVLVANSTGC